MSIPDSPLFLLERDGRHNRAGRVANLAVSGEAWIEFDGFYRNTITLSSAEPVRIEGLAIEIPIKPEFDALFPLERSQRLRRIHF